MPETKDTMIERLVKKLTREGDKKIVVAIDGYSGSGKTTLLKELARRNKAILPVFLDDFMRTGKSRRALLKKSKDKSKVVELR